MLSLQFASVPRPRSVLRQSSLKLFEMMDKSAASTSSSPNTLLLGPTGSGLSTLLLQSFSYALESSWIVIYIPRSINLVDSSSPFAYSEALQTYLQPDIARGILEKLLAINQNHMSKLSIRGKAITLDRGLTLAEKTSLTLVAQEGLKKTTSPTATQQILEIVLKSLVQQTETPVLMAIDGAQALFSTTRYRDADYRELKSYELAVPRLLQSCLRKNGPGSLGGIKKGKVVAAFSLQHKEWPVSDELKSALELETVDPYTKLDPIMHAIIQDCDFERLGLELDLTKPEATSLFEVAKEEGQLWHASSDEHLMSKLVESGGSIGVFDRSLRKSAM
jgi:small subunit ribosomal protein S29